MKIVFLNSIIAVGIGVGALTWITYRHLRRKRQRQSQPKEDEWLEIGVIAEMTLYPLKSCAAIELDEAECCEYGLRFNGFCDRNLLLLKDDNQVTYGAVHPLMLNIKSCIIGNQLLTLTAPNTKPLTLDIQQLVTEGSIKEQRKRGYRRRLVECRPEHHVWFCRYILNKDSGLRLFVVLDPIIEKNWWRNTSCDFMPIMVMHERSIEDLNSRLLVKNQAHYQQFRGNLLIRSGANIKAFNEDNWQWLKIGNKTDRVAILRYNSPCMRCIFPNIDVETCQRNPDFEPLKTMRKYRLRSHPKDPEMGVYFDIVQTGVIRKGDPVFVQYRNN